MGRKRHFCTHFDAYLLYIVWFMLTISSSNATEQSEIQDTLENSKPGPELVLIPAEQPFALGKYEVTVSEYATFTAATGYLTYNERQQDEKRHCKGLTPTYWSVPGTNWRNPGFIQGPDHPVVCVTWQDAEAYAQWLSDQTGQRYRLPTTLEWVYAASAGVKTLFHFGNDKEEMCKYGNVAGLANPWLYGNTQLPRCDDEHLYTSPVGFYRPNAFGLYDVHGNVKEITATCTSWFERSKKAQPTCNWRDSRGGAWPYAPFIAHLTNTGMAFYMTSDYATGFRVLRELPIEKE